MGAEGVSVHVNIGADTEGQMLRDFAETAEDCRRLNVPLLAMMYARGPRLPVEHLPAGVRERLEEIGIERTVHLTFDRPGPSGTVHAHRGHPLVRALAEHVAEAALSDRGEIASR